MGDIFQTLGEFTAEAIEKASAFLRTDDISKHAWQQSSLHDQLTMVVEHLNKQDGVSEGKPAEDKPEQSQPAPPSNEPEPLKSVLEGQVKKKKKAIVYEDGDADTQQRKYRFLSTMLVGPGGNIDEPDGIGPAMANREYGKYKERVAAHMSLPEGLFADFDGISADGVGKFYTSLTERAKAVHKYAKGVDIENGLAVAPTGWMKVALECERAIENSLSLKKLLAKEKEDKANDLDQLTKNGLGVATSSDALSAAKKRELLLKGTAPSTKKPRKSPNNDEKKNAKLSEEDDDNSDHPHPEEPLDAILQSLANNMDRFFAGSNGPAKSADAPGLNKLLTSAGLGHHFQALSDAGYSTVLSLQNMEKKELCMDVPTLKPGEANLILNLARKY